MQLSKHKSAGSVLLIAGTCIGAGMLALPITTGVAGFFNSIVLFIACFIYMLTTLFLLFEATQYSDRQDTNIISLAREHLGLWAEVTAWFCFLLLLYAATAAYLSGGGSLIAKLLVFHQKNSLSATTGTWGFLAFGALLLFFGASCIDCINRLLMTGLIVSYFTLLIIVAPHVSWHNLTLNQPEYLWAGVPVVILAFTSHVIMPTIRSYVSENILNLKKVLLLGSLIPLIFYVIWQFIITGIMPLRELLSVTKSASPIAALTSTLQHDLGLLGIAIAISVFSFCALVTSFLGATLSIQDFIADGLKIRRTISGRVLLLILTLGPPLLFALFYPNGFVMALTYAGALVAILYGIIPPCLVWKARYSKKLNAEFQVPGGRAVLILSILGALMVVILQIGVVMHWLPMIK